MLGNLRKWFKLWKSQFTIRQMPNRRCEGTGDVLVIKLDAIGDFIIWLDSAKEYRGIFANKRCVLLCNEPCKELAELTGYFDEVMSLDIRKFEGDEKYADELAARFSNLRFDTVVQTAYSRTQHMDGIAACIPARIKIGFEADESKSNVSRRLATKKSKAAFDAIYDKIVLASEDNLMELQRNQEFIRGLGKKDFVAALPRLPHVEGVGIPAKPYFLVFPGASSTKKMWRPENFAEVINCLHERMNWKCCVCGGKNEGHLFDAIEGRVNRKDLLVNYFGETSLVSLIEIVRNAELVISNDTSGIHYAAATNAPGICVFGEYNYGRFLPYEAEGLESHIAICSAKSKCRNCSSSNLKAYCMLHILLKGKYLCLDKVDPSHVISKIEKNIPTS